MMVLMVVDRMAVEAAPRDSRYMEKGCFAMEWFFAFVGLMLILAIIRLRNGSKHSNGQTMGSNEPVHYWIGTEIGNSDVGSGLDSGSTESGGGSFDGGSSDGGGGDSSGF